MQLLKVNDLTIKFGGLTAVSDFALNLSDHDLVGLIGPNGAGKTTIFNMLTGVYAPTSGTIEFNGEFIQGIKPYDITKKRIARTFQNIRLFKDLTVLDNVKISFNYNVKYNLFHSILRLPKFNKEEAEIEEKALEILKVFNLDGKRNELACNLPYGEQRRLEIARALAAEPKLLLLDEPAAGMNPQETHELMGLINWVRDEFKIAILLIEHDMKLVMGVCERIIVVDYGKVIAEGSPDEIKNNPKVIEAYLGEEVTDA
ncbi:ABC transporter ATP-binding protein [Clostridium estertheticum]|uniref:ABC transporter ATP-binding protein n=1 Tax=Clostridium estertheticum TaxID=238834 RepID=UPI001C6E266E|nr:ABC transporter ATP-binding protein [Clostridium estertheticum]MBW9152659.1 ABC transporter ATP-binding protein [Clostridium estertheticum]WLC86016.1 ABC transporter ATP-binding protein [Clostridium estertheticum]